MKISSTLIQKLKPTFLISNLTQYLPPKEPLSLSRLAKMRVQDSKTAGGLPSDTIPDLQQDTTTKMQEIEISKNGLLKLLKNVKPGKAAGPDRLKPLLLRELREEIAPIIKIIFDRSLQTGKLPADWVKANVMPVLNLWHQATDLSLSLAFFARSSNTFSLPTLSSTLMGRVSCMIYSMALEKRGHVRPSSSCSLRISRGMPVWVNKQT